MRQGKVPFQTFKRSVWRFAGAKRPEVLRAAGPGCDGAAFAPEAGGCVVSAGHSFVWRDSWAFQAAFYRTFGDIAAAGGRAVALRLGIVLPPEAEEPHLRAMMQEVDRLARAEGVAIIGGHTTSAPEVTCAVVSLTVEGERPAAWREQRPRPGQAIVATRAIGLEGTALLTLRQRARLSERYTDEFLIGAERFLQELSVAPEAAVAIQHGETAMHNGAEGGIFGALWEFAERGGLGMEVELGAIPIRQETVEICEFLGKNPYELAAGGLMLIAADNGAALIDALRRADIPAAVIGHFTPGPARILRRDGEVRYLDLPQQDALWEE